MDSPKADGDKWVDWAYVKGRSALKPCKALRIRDVLEEPIIIEQYWPVKFKYYYESATNGRNPKPRQDLRVLKREQEARKAASIIPSIEGEDDSSDAPMRDSNGFTTTFNSLPRSGSKKRKRGEEHNQRKRQETVEEKKKRKQKKIYISPYYEYRENRGQMDPEKFGLPKPKFDPVVEAAREKILAGKNAPDYSHIVDKKEDDEISWVDSEEEIDTSDSEDEDRGCYGKKQRSDTEELGYETERLSTPEMEAIIEQHSQEFNSPAARAQRNAILAQWAEEDANGIFFGRPIRRSAQVRPATPSESGESDKTEELLDPAVSVQSGAA